MSAVSLADRAHLALVALVVKIARVLASHKGCKDEIGRRVRRRPPEGLRLSAGQRASPSKTSHVGQHRGPSRARHRAGKANGEQDLMRPAFESE